VAHLLTKHQRLHLERLLGLWEYLVDEKVGVIKNVYELPIDEDDPNFFHYLSTACNTARFTPLSNFCNNGGVSTNRYGAIAKAMGEAVERYCSAIFRYEDLIFASFNNLDQPAVAPDRFALYSPEQFSQDNLPWRPFTSDSPVYWTKGTSLVSGEELLVPAAMVYVPFHFDSSRDDTPICQPISTGLACGSSFTDAVLSGLCEVIERDAFTITWQSRLNGPRIRPETLSAAAQDRLARFSAVNLDVKIMDITTDVQCPTIMTIALSDSEVSPALALAAATDLSADIAVIKSLEELAHTRKFAKQLSEYTPPVPVEVAEGHPNVVDAYTHLRFYCPQSARQFAEFAWASPELRDFPSVVDRSAGDDEESLKSLVGDLSALGLEAIACDLTTPEMADLGLSVVRVLVPGMHPLFMGHRNRALGGRRLYEVPKKLGQRGLESGEPDNPYPHPFP
jgi:ribosomal protein S12 methylthiotransferase accessory factor